MIKDADSALGKSTGVMEKLQTIYHGVNFKHFHPLSEKKRQEFRTQYFEGKVKEETFLVSAIARNQMRKDLPRTMNIFKEFQRRRPNSFLYLHCQETDAWGSLREYARNWDLKLGEDWGVPSKFSSNLGFPIEFMNLLYNGSDAILSTSLGEGFGFYNLEGFATKCPVVAPNNTTHPELFGYDKNEDITNMNKLFENGVRGIPMLSGSTSSEWAVYGAEDYERPRPLTNVDDGVKKLVWLYDNPEKSKEIAQRAFDWVQDYSWQHVVRDWDKLFIKVYNELQEERSKVKYKPPKKKLKHEQIGAKKDKIKMGLA
jgi:glycosyltransferase involved in cell wall biosynthesis